MEIVIISGLIGAGYYFSKDGVDRKDNYDLNLNKNYLSKDQLNGKNIYESKKSFNIRNNEQEESNKLYSEAINNPNSNLVFPGPPESILNKIDYSDKELPIEYNNNPPNISPLLKKKDIYDTNDMSYLQNVSSLDSGGGNPIIINGQPLNSSTFKSLSGTELKKDDFIHNNMTPFFGGSIKQNMDEYSTSAVLENFTGNINNYQKKKEVGTMFKPTTNISNIYGSQNLDEHNYDIGPTEKLNVGPGLNQGYTWQPSGGVQQSDTRDYVLPKTTNELRVKTNPKLSFHGRVISGEAINKPGKIGIVEKNRPDNFSVWGKDRLFTTVGACVGNKQRPKVPLKCSNRMETGLKQRINPAGPAVYHKNKTPMGKASPTFKQVLRSLGFGVAKKSDGTNIRNKQQPRFTRKTNVVGNSRWASNIQGPHNRHKVYNPNDIAKTTIKETNIHDSIKNNLTPAQPAKSVIYDPNDIAKTTIKETNIHDSIKNNLTPAQPSKNIIYDPNDIAKVTVKETTHIEDHFNNPKKTRDDGYQNSKIEAPVTHRQCYDQSTYTGDAHGPESGGYTILDPKPKNTTRQFTSDNEYSGIAGSSANDKAMSYEDIYNSTIKSVRQDVSKGRTPSTQGVKQQLGSDDMNVSMNKETEVNNKRIDERGIQSTKVYNSLPTMNKCNETTDKATLPNEPLRNRLDPVMVDAFKDNPYTQSLSSYVFN